MRFAGAATFLFLLIAAGVSKAGEQVELYVRVLPKDPAAQVSIQREGDVCAGDRASPVR